MQREVWTGIAWAAGLVLAMAGVFAYSAATFEFPEYDVTWEAQSQTVEESGSAMEGDQYTFTFPVSGERIEEIEFDLDWTDDNGNNDRFELAVTGPTDEWTTAQDGADGAITIDFAIMDFPDTSRGAGFNETAAVEDADPNEPAWEGIFEWTVMVTLRDAPAAECGTPCIQEPGPDGENDFTLTVTTVSYEGTATPA